MLSPSTFKRKASEHLKKLSSSTTWPTMSSMASMGEPALTLPAMGNDTPPFASGPPRISSPLEEAAFLLMKPFFSRAPKCFAAFCGPFMPN